MLRPNLHQLLCIRFGGCVFQFFLLNELFVRRGILGMWGERAGLSLVLYILSVSLVLVLLVARSQPPRRAWLCWGNPRFHLLLCSSPVFHAGRSPSHGQWRSPSSFTTPCAEFRPSHAEVWPATCCSPGSACFSFRCSYSLWHRLSPLQLPSFPALRSEDAPLHTVRDDM